MGGQNFSATQFGWLGLILAASSLAYGQDSAPVVTIKQPISFTSYGGPSNVRQLGFDGAPSDTVPTLAPSTATPDRDAPIVSGEEVGSVVSTPDAAPIVTAAEPAPIVTAAEPAPVMSAAPSSSSCGAGCDVPGAACLSDQAVSLCDQQGLNGASCDGMGCDDCGGLACGGRGCGARSCGVQCLPDLCSPSKFWIRADYLMWWSNEAEIPALVTSSPGSTPINDVGVLGRSTTSNRFHGPLFDDFRNGGRIRFGGNNCGQCAGWEGSLWFVENLRDEQSFSSDGNPAFARPFFNADPLVNGPDAQLISYPGVLDGRVQVNTSSEILGGDLGIRCNVFCCQDFCGASSTRFDLYAGYRYFQVREGLRIEEQLVSTALTGPVALGTRTDLYDDFRTKNEFHGANLGFIAASQWGRWTGEAILRLGVGNISRHARIRGATTVTVPGQTPVRRAGGLLAQPSNIGDYEDCEFAILPEFQLGGAYAINQNLKLTLGYTFMYLGDLLRPGDIIDPVVNGQFLDSSIPNTGPSRPRYQPRDDKMWLMGLSVGMEYRF